MFEDTILAFGAEALEEDLVFREDVVPHGPYLVTRHKLKVPVVAGWPPSSWSWSGATRERTRKRAREGECVRAIKKEKEPQFSALQHAETRAKPRSRRVGAYVSLEETGTISMRMLAGSAIEFVIGLTWNHQEP